ncbi:MAG: hypothetical protein ACOC8X_09110 [Chloroflexota bacterium]
MAIREGRWDCQYCGAKGLLGRDKVCPNCATSRPEGTKFYIPEDEAAVEDEKLLQQARKGADWICEYCSSSNPADLDACRHCAAPREGTSPQQEVKQYAPGEAPRSGDMTVPDPHEKYRQEPEPEPARKERPRWLAPAIAGGLLLLALLCGFLFLRSDNVDVTVAGVSWERTVVVEALETVTEEGWDVPDGARLLDEREEIRRYDQVVVGHETKQREVSEEVQVGERTYVCGQEDLGNGFFEDIECTEPVYETQTRMETYEEPVYQQVPVYDTMYTYEVDKWVEARIEKAEGIDLQPQWPALTLAENEREGERQERYRIVFVDGEGKEYAMQLPHNEWLQFEPSGRYQLKVNGMGQAVEVVQ